MTEHTPGPWKWWTSNSWRRLKRDDRGISQNVLEPYICSSDGHPDVLISDSDMRLIAAAPDLAEACQEAWHALMWIINYDSDDKCLARAIAKIETAVNKSGVYNYEAMKARVDAQRTRPEQRA